MTPERERIKKAITKAQLSVKDLSIKFKLSYQAVAQIVKRMEQDGQVRRETVFIEKMNYRNKPTKIQKRIVVWTGEGVNNE